MCLEIINGQHEVCLHVDYLELGGGEMLEHPELLHVVGLEEITGDSQGITRSPTLRLGTQAETVETTLDGVETFIV
jgi:hypothetical protein